MGRLRLVHNFEAIVTLESETEHTTQEGSRHLVTAILETRLYGEGRNIVLRDLRRRVAFVAATNIGVVEIGKEVGIAMMDEEEAVRGHPIAEGVEEADTEAGVRGVGMLMKKPTYLCQGGIVGMYQNCRSLSWMT